MRKRSTWVAWLLLAIFAVSVIIQVTLSVANGIFQQEPLADHVALLLAFTAFMVVGALIVAHRPGNAIGWIFSAIALLAITGAMAQEYGVYAYVTRPGALPGAILMGWYASWTWYPTSALVLVFTPLLFPTGRLVSPRWRPVAWLAGAATVAVTVLAALQPALGLAHDRVVPNPIGVAGLENPDKSTVGTVLLGLVVVSMVAAVVSLVVRFRRSRGDERQQLKWFTSAGALLPLVALADVVPDAVSNLLFAVVIVFLPVAAGIAVLRYRLYDIDRLINRTLVYGLLTTVLGLGYVTGSLVFVLLFGIGATPPSWVVAGSTLAAAAVFRPARRRIQAAVDRRFNRRRYDAAKTIEAFSARLRDEIDLDTLTVELLAVVHQTMEPATVSLWLRPPARTSHANAVEPSTAQPPGRPVASGPVPRAL